MSADLSLSRRDHDWLLNVSDFAADEYHPQFVTMRLHVTQTARLKVRQFSATKEHAAFVALQFGPHAQIFLSRMQAAELGDLLEILFPAGATAGDEQPPPATSSVDGYSLDTSTAPAEPRIWNAFPTQFEETP